MFLFFPWQNDQACSYLFRYRHCFGNINNIVNHPIQPSSLWCSSPCPCRGKIKPSSMSASHHGFRLVNGAKLHAEGWNLSYTRCWSHALQHCAALGTSQMIRKAPKGRITKTVTKVSLLYNRLFNKSGWVHRWYHWWLVATDLSFSVQMKLFDSQTNRRTAKEVVAFLFFLVFIRRS